MNRQIWEQEYRTAADRLHTPNALDEKILSHAKSYAPIKRQNRTLSKAASGFSALAVAIVLLHPAQYLGALTPAQSGPDLFGQHTDTRSKLNPALRQQKQTLQPDRWHSLRTEVRAGNLVPLCAQWRRQQQGAADSDLPKDLTAKAEQHCRILP